jgi:hypothetical protein
MLKDSGEWYFLLFFPECDISSFLCCFSKYLLSESTSSRNFCSLFLLLLTIDDLALSFSFSKKSLIFYFNVGLTVFYYITSARMSFHWSMLSLESSPVPFRMLLYLLEFSSLTLLIASFYILGFSYYFF